MSYLPWDGPDFHIGNGPNLATMTLTLVLVVMTYSWMIRDTRSRQVELLGS